MVITEYSHMLVVGVLDRQLPHGVPEVGVRGGTRRDLELMVRHGTHD
jgi:hypothetical protein